MAQSPLIDTDPSNHSATEASWELEDAFGPSRELSLEGPWSNFPTLAAWVEVVYDSSTRKLGAARSRAERYGREAKVYGVNKERVGFEPGEDPSDMHPYRAEMVKYKQDSVAEASRLAADIKEFLVTVGPTGVTYGDILDAIRARKERESSSARAAEALQAREAALRAIGEMAIRAYDAVHQE